MAHTVWVQFGGTLPTMFEMQPGETVADLILKVTRNPVSESDPSICVLFYNGNQLQPEALASEIQMTSSESPTIISMAPNSTQLTSKSDEAWANHVGWSLKVMPVAAHFLAMPFPYVLSIYNGYEKLKPD
jgi:hypothetical protein